MIYDVIVIGLGPAGISASIYAKRAGLNVLVLDGKYPGGLLNNVRLIQNYPGYKSISGPDLAEKLYEHFQSYDIEFKNENVNEIKNDTIKEVITNNATYKTKNIIIATGRKQRSLGLDNENDLIGSGISYCALCDGNLFENKDIAVFGNGANCLEETLYLSNIVKKIYLVVPSNKLVGNKDDIDSINKKENIEIILNNKIQKLISENFRLKTIKLDSKDIDVSGLFIYNGYAPTLPFKMNFNLKINEGYIVVDRSCKTNIEGIYAIGDIIEKDVYQMITAEAEGAIAVAAISRGNKNE